MSENWEMFLPHFFPMNNGVSLFGFIEILDIQLQSTYRNAMFVTA